MNDQPSKAKQPRERPTITFTCSKHGPQPLMYFIYAGIRLACWCTWEDQDDHLVCVNDRRPGGGRPRKEKRKE